MQGRMPALRPLTDTSAADWVVQGIAGRFGYDVASVVPPVFEGYARLQHPFHADQQPVDVSGSLADDTLDALVAALARHTTTPERCYFCLWDGFGGIHGSPSVAVWSDGWSAGGMPARSWRRLVRRRGRRYVAIPPAFAPDVMDGPRVKLPNREYLLFEGPLADAGQWGAADLLPGMARHPINSPNLFWPADRAWLVATEIDLPATYIGGTEASTSELVDTLTEHHDLDVRPVSPHDRVSGEL